jgi:hypothetical protein
VHYLLCAATDCTDCTLAQPLPEIVDVPTGREKAAGVRPAAARRVLRMVDSVGKRDFASSMNETTGFLLLLSHALAAIEIGEQRLPFLSLLGD